MSLTVDVRESREGGLGKRTIDGDPSKSTNIGDGPSKRAGMHRSWGLNLPTVYFDGEGRVLGSGKTKEQPCYKDEKKAQHVGRFLMINCGNGSCHGE